MDDPLSPGRMYTRAEVRAELGGSTQGGIVPSTTGKTILLYSDQSKASEYGYEDGWVTADNGERVYEYSGTGQNGHQHLRGLNGSVLHHRERGFDTIRVFVAHEAPKGAQRFRYIGQFLLDEACPYLLREARDAKKELRNAVIFRLRPMGHVDVDLTDFVTPAFEATVARWIPAVPLDELEVGATHGAASEQIAPELSSTRVFERKMIAALEGQRREAELSGRFETFLRAQHKQVTRFEIRVKGRSSPLRTDLYNATDSVLFEVKSTVARDAVRLAIGQLLDYQRYLNPRPAVLAILLPEAPEPDLRSLIEAVGMSLVYEEGGTYIGWPLGVPV